MLCRLRAHVAGEQSFDAAGRSPAGVMREARRGVLRQIAPKKLPGHCLLPYRRACEIRVETLKQSRARVERGLPAPEPADLAFAKEIVAGKHFVGAFAGQHNLDAAGAHQARQQEQWRRRRSQDRALGVVDDLRKNLGDVAARDHHFMVLTTGDTGDQSLEVGLIIFGVSETQ